MAGFRSEERVPLLLEREASLTEGLDRLQSDIEVEYHVPRNDGQKAFRRGGADGARQGSSFLSAVDITRRKKKHFTGNEMIVAVFVVAFDTKKGNIVEWRYPAEVYLEGVEFKSIASGLHKIPKDFIYFKQNQLFGLSCFEKIPVASHEERGARMKSVGLLAVGFSDLHFHMDFLQRQVRIQVETPGEYGSLEEYFRHYQSPRQLVPRPFSDPGMLQSDEEDSGLLPPMAITHPAGCFTQFLQFFGAHIFVLWRLALLKKRIILFSPPPIGVVCYRVYCACMLAQYTLELPAVDTEPSPQFYVNVADIEQLQSLDSYIACTTEKVFQDKVRLFDIFVDNQNITSHRAVLDPLLRVTSADEERFEHLNNIRSNHFATAGGAGSSGANDELGFAEFFQELNGQLFRTVSDASSSEDHVLTVEMVESLGLHAVQDAYFLTELAQVYGFNITVQRPMDMFSCCL